MTAPIRIEAQHRLPVSVHDGFEYVTDPNNWPEYWPRLVRIASARRWREPGDRVCLVLRMLRREVELEMTLVQIEPYRLVEYTSEQRGLPAARLAPLRPRWRQARLPDRCRVPAATRVAKTLRRARGAPGGRGHGARDAGQPGAALPGTVVARAARGDACISGPATDKGSRRLFEPHLRRCSATADGTLGRPLHAPVAFAVRTA
jgi:hypothetical protein